MTNKLEKKSSKLAKKDKGYTKYVIAFLLVVVGYAWHYAKCFDDQA